MEQAAVEDLTRDHPTDPPSGTLSRWKWIVIGAAVWLLAMFPLEWISASRQAYHQRAALAFKQATLVYIEDVSADQQIQKLKNARQAFEAVATQFPGTEAASVARFYSIRISYRLKEWAKAESDLKAFIERGHDPDDYIIRAMEVRYQIYKSGGEAAKANDYFREVVEADQAR